MAELSYIVIPARLESTRLRDKLLLRETGKPLIQHTYEAAQQAKRPIGSCVATDHSAIRREVEAFGGHVEMTSRLCANGTERTAEVAKRLCPEIELIVNVQGDQPEIESAAIDKAIIALENAADAVVSTVVAPIHSRQQLDDPSCVKVVLDSSSRALYFSRSSIPHPRSWDDRLLSASPTIFYQHLGIYVYRRAFLQEYCRLPAGRLEQVEMLEQLRILEAGHKIAVAIVDAATQGIDTHEDYEAFVARQRQRAATT